MLLKIYPMCYAAEQTQGINKMVDPCIYHIVIINIFIYLINLVIDILSSSQFKFSLCSICLI